MAEQTVTENGGKAVRERGNGIVPEDQRVPARGSAGLVQYGGEVVPFYL